MSKFILTFKATFDLLSIGRYTQKKWNIQQRNIYLNEINSMFSTLADNPEMGKRCDYIREGYYKFPIGKHIIFYQRHVKNITVIRILHQSMDYEKHF